MSIQYNKVVNAPCISEPTIVPSCHCSNAHCYHCWKHCNTLSPHRIDVSEGKLYPNADGYATLLPLTSEDTFVLYDTQYRNIIYQCNQVYLDKAYRLEIRHTTYNDNFRLYSFDGKWILIHNCYSDHNDNTTTISLYQMRNRNSTSTSSSNSSKQNQSQNHSGTIATDLTGGENVDVADDILAYYGNPRVRRKLEKQRKRASRKRVKKCIIQEIYPRKRRVVTLKGHIDLPRTFKYGRNILIFPQDKQRVLITDIRFERIYSNLFYFDIVHACNPNVLMIRPDFSTAIATNSTTTTTTTTATSKDSIAKYTSLSLLQQGSSATSVMIPVRKKSIFKRVCSSIASKCIPSSRGLDKDFNTSLILNAGQSHEFYNGNGESSGGGGVNYYDLQTIKNQGDILFFYDVKKRRLLSIPGVKFQTWVSTTAPLSPSTSSLPSSLSPLSSTQEEKEQEPLDDGGGDDVYDVVAAAAAARNHTRRLLVVLDHDALNYIEFYRTNQEKNGKSETSQDNMSDYDPKHSTSSSSSSSSESDNSDDIDHDDDDDDDDVDVNDVNDAIGRDDNNNITTMSMSLNGE